MKSTISLPRCVGLVISLAFVAGPASAQVFFASKKQAFVQTSTAAPVANPLGAFLFEASFEANVTSAVTLTLPSGAAAPASFVVSDDGEGDLSAAFSTKAALDAAYPNGAYGITGAGLPNVVINLLADAYTAATPQVVGGTWNSGGLLVLNPAQANTITFSNFSDYGTNGVVASHQAFNLEGTTPGAGSVELSNDIATQAFGDITVSATPFTSFTIPAIKPNTINTPTLVSGQAYHAYLEFDRIVMFDLTSIPGGGIIGLFSKTLDFYIAAQTPGTSTAGPVITTQPANQTGPLGSSVTFSIGTTFGGSTQTNFQTTNFIWNLNGKPLPFSQGSTKYTFGGSPNGVQTLTVNNLTAADVGVYSVTIVNAGGIVLSANATYAIGAATPPTFTQQPATSQIVGPGGSAQFNATASGTVTYQWQRNGTNIPGAVGSTLQLSGAGLIAGAYTAVATGVGGSTTSNVGLLIISTSNKVDGAASEIGSDILHPLGQTYDQVLLTGTSATIRADPGQVTRMSFIDLNDDIVQVEFTGAGRLALTLDNASGPATAVKYNQPTVNYMKGHASIVVSGADQSTNVSVFSVGRGNAVNQALFRDDVTYDGHADIAYLAIASINGQFAGARTANASYFSTKGMTGFYAPGVTFNGPVFVGDINAFDDASPTFVIGGGSDVRITGGDLLQTNGRPVTVGGITQLKFTAGSSSQGPLEPAQTNKGVLLQNGVDVTAQIVVYPGP